MGIMEIVKRCWLPFGKAEATTEEEVEAIITQYEDLWRQAAVEGRAQFHWTRLGLRTTGLTNTTCAAWIGKNDLVSRALEVEIGWVCECGARSGVLATALVHLNNDHEWTWDRLANKFRDAWREGVERARRSGQDPGRVGPRRARPRRGRDPGDAGMTAEEILATAADLTEFGPRWAQRPGVDQACAALLLNEAAYDPDSIWSRPLARAHQALKLEIGYAADVPTCESIFVWNDAPGRTKEEVAATMRNAKRHLAELP